MMKTFVLSALCVALCNVTKAQVLPNGGFEAWDTTSQGLVPSGWYSDFSAEHSVRPDTGAFSGGYAVKIVSATPGIEGPYYGFISTKVAAVTASGTLTCKVSVDSVQHWDPDSSYAIIRIDTSAVFDGWNMSYPHAGLWRRATVTNGFIDVNVPFDLPAGVDSFYVHLVARNVTQSLTNLNLGFMGFRVDDASIAFTTNVESPRHHEIYFFPNPGDGILLSTGQCPYNRYRVFDPSGRTVAQGLVSETLDLKFLRSGAYIIAFTNAYDRRETATLRFVKQ